MFIEIGKSFFNTDKIKSITITTRREMVVIVVYLDENDSCQFEYPVDQFEEVFNEVKKKIEAINRR